jgi:Carboxypeptidase regulatory-like domain
VKMRNVVVAGAIAGIAATLSLPAMKRLFTGSPGITALAAQTSEDISGLTLRGSVMDTVTKKPIAGALVDLDGDPPRQGSSPAAGHQQNARGAEQRTDANGEFTFRHVSWDSHFFSLTKNGYTSATDDGIEYSSYEVHPGQQMGPLRMFLTPAAELAGHVTSDTGAALKGVALTLYSERAEDGRRVWMRQKETSTDAQGFYSFPGLKYGHYVVVSGWTFDHDGASSLCGAVRLFANSESRRAGFFQGHSDPATAGSTYDCRSQAARPAFSPGLAARLCESRLSVWQRSG